MPKINRDDLTEFIIRYERDNGRRPSAREVGDRFDVTSGFARRVACDLLGDPNFFRDAQRDRQHSTRTADADRAYAFIVDYIDRYEWAPSQREVGDALGCSVQHAHAVLNKLEADGLIVKGPHPRQLRIVASAMKAPEHRL